MWQLADGSVLHLNTDSSVTVRFSEHERLVTLRQGQALFEVAHEAVRPFRVNSGDSSTVAVGTEFDVYRRGDATQITVVKGRVLVYPGPLSVSSSASMAGDEHSLSVSAGQQTTVRSGVMPTAPVNADLSRAVAWLERQIVFDQQPLDEVPGNLIATMGSALRSMTQSYAHFRSAASLMPMTRLRLRRFWAPLTVSASSGRES